MLPTPVFPATYLRSFQKARSSNSTDASFPSRPATMTRPTGVGVQELNRTSGWSLNTIHLQVYGTGAENSTITGVRVLGWRDTPGGLWVPTILAELAATLSAFVGVAGADVADTERFADTLTITYGNAGVDVEVISPANDTPAHALVDTQGCPIVEFIFDLGTATAANALWAGV